MAKIVKLVVEYNSKGKQNRIIYENKNGLRKIEIPDLKSSKITLYSDNEKKYNISYKELCLLKLADSPDCVDKENEITDILFGFSEYGFDVDEISVTPLKETTISYSDITENMLLGFPILDSEIINSINNGGLWSDYGKRLILITVENYPFDEDSSFHITGSVKITHCDNSEIIFDSCDVVKKEKDKYIWYFDTDKLNFCLDQKFKATIKSYFSLRNIKDDKTEVTYEIPFSIVLNNTDTYDRKNKYLCVDSASKVSIDFGTSSTCVAIKSNVISMIEMNLDTAGASAYSVYEIPTNIMMFNWKELSENWNNDVHPILRRYNTAIEYGPVSFDFGHPVKDIQIKEQRELDSIISQLKMIPQVISDGKTIKFRDYNDSNEFEVVDENGNEECFNPIEFYGYLLGKAINHPNGNINKYYTKYLLSYPVKFSESARKKIQDSLTRGLIRSLPNSIQNLKNEKGNSVFQVKMKYSEPIACIGAVCGEELKIKDGKPTLFGIFDFGGGTADYSFGMYRAADIDSEGRKEAIELFGVDGDEYFGGELIINKISYWILVNNKEKIIENGIVFEKPKDELMEDGFGNLVLNTIGASANIRMINENISRPFFEGKNSSIFLDEESDDEKTGGRADYSGKKDAEIGELYSIKSENSKVKIKLSIDFDDLKNKLKELFRKKCQIFSRSMDNAFNIQENISTMIKYNTEYKKENVTIILSGNSSRHPMVKECLKEIFEKNEIYLVGAERTENTINRYKITPKTAVSIGALKLEQMLINKHKELSLIYVYYEDSPNHFEKIINGDLSDKKWKFSGVITDGMITVYICQNDSDDPKSWNPVMLEFEDDEESNSICYIRQSGRDKIEYISVPVGIDPNFDEDDSEYEISSINIR